MANSLRARATRGVIPACVRRGFPGGREMVVPTGVEGESAGVSRNGRALKSGAGIDGNRGCG